MHSRAFTPTPTIRRDSAVTATNATKQTAYAANVLNQYAEISSTIPSAPQTSIQPQYDLGGNMTYDGEQWHYIRNGENRLMLASNDTCAVNYAYDHMGRMIRKTIAGSNPASHKTIAYVLDDFNTTAETVVASESAESTYNICGLDLSRTLATSEYDSFGGVASTAGDEFTHWFSTKPYSPTAGVCEYQFRMYHPELEMWLNRDPMEETR